VVIQNMVEKGLNITNSYQGGLLMFNAINWFEIPVLEMDRALNFYGAVLETELTASEFEDTLMAFLPSEDGVGGALVEGEGYIPSMEGSLIYLNGGKDLSVFLNRIESAGGRIVLPKTGIGEHGFIAFFADTEGNRVGLHSPS
jgi:hypothetical protein